MFRAFLLITLLLASSSCMQTENSNSLDADTYSGEGSAEFVAAKAVLSSLCKDCHVYHTMTQDELINAGDIVPGSPESSKIYYRLSGSSGGPGPKNMPTNGSISNGDRALIKVWIQNAN